MNKGIMAWRKLGVENRELVVHQGPIEKSRDMRWQWFNVRGCGGCSMVLSWDSRSWFRSSAFHFLLLIKAFNGSWSRLGSW